MENYYFTLIEIINLTKMSCSWIKKKIFSNIDNSAENETQRKK